MVSLNEKVYNVVRLLHLLTKPLDDEKSDDDW